MTSHSRSCCGVIVSMKLNQEKRFWKYVKKKKKTSIFGLVQIVNSGLFCCFTGEWLGAGRQVRRAGDECW